jgi:hypothetical protein
MPDEVLPAVESPAPTKAEVVAMILKQQEESFLRADHDERLKIALQRKKTGRYPELLGLKFDNPSIEYSLDELKVLVPLERDRMNYNWENKDKGTHGVLAKNKHGLLSIGKQRGRLKQRMNKHQQGIKSASLRIFRELFTKRAELLQATAATEKIEYLGIPDAMLPKLGAVAAQLAMKEVKAKRRSKRDVRKRMQQASRKVNYGLLAGNQAHNFIMKGNQYGA